ncbi:MAG: cyclic nucleotide-binding domain-containing protein [Lachnospiraceae bacterium]|nr:cyclic nucleotide-binding domain-containing protein [Lachnospiraceae bacterium]
MNAKMVKYPQETVIVREGELNADMFKIISGHAEVYVGFGSKQETLIKIIGPQCCFGELGMLLDKPSIYTVRAYSDLLALRINREDMFDFVKENQKNVIDIMRNMASTMMTMRFHIDLLIKEIESGHKPDPHMLQQARKAMKGYGMFRSIQEASDILTNRQ